jgi:hypothetical protein
MNKGPATAPGLFYAWGRSIRTRGVTDKGPKSVSEILAPGSGPGASSSWSLKKWLATRPKYKEMNHMTEEQINNWIKSKAFDEGWYDGYDRTLVAIDREIGLAAYIELEEYPEDFADLGPGLEGPVRLIEITDELDCCYRCDGTGEWLDDESDEEIACNDCDGTGAGIRSAAGLELYAEAFGGAFLVRIESFGSYGSTIAESDLDRATHLIRIEADYEDHWPGYTPKELAEKFIEERTMVWEGDIWRIQITDARHLVNDSLGGCFGRSFAEEEALTAFDDAHAGLRLKIQSQRNAEPQSA